MQISIIIPTYNEAENIGKLVAYLITYGGQQVIEIIVADAGSNDDTRVFAETFGARVILSPSKGRAEQMNYGALSAKGDILYFVHADVFPPQTFVNDIQDAVKEGYDLGRYTMKFNTKKWYLCINEFFTRFDLFVCYGGDQTLFITRKLFEAAGGFSKDMLIMEDFEFTQRARQLGRYRIFQKGARISDRKYNHNSWWQVQKANYTIVKMYKKGASQNEMVKKYGEMLDYRDHLE
jgi:rSAM/selenodomain-associated transferase 2